MFRSHPEEHLHLRMHRARSVVLTNNENGILELTIDRRLVEVRAAQRTFEGAYMRTALGQFSFSLVILKIFTAEFYAIGALFAVYGAAILLVAIYRRYEGHRQFFTKEGAGGSFSPKFRTSTDTVTLLTGLSLSAYAALLILTWRLAT